MHRNRIATIADKGVFDTAVTPESGLQPEEVYNILNQLDSLGLIKIAPGGRKPVGCRLQDNKYNKGGLGCNFGETTASLNSRSSFSQTFFKAGRDIVALFWTT